MQRIKMIPYEVPLRPDDSREDTARLILPADLTRADAERLTAFIMSLAFDPPSEEPHWPHSDGAGD